MPLSFKIDQYRKVLRDWDFQTDIGRGSAGTIVYKIIRKRTGRFEEIRALKAIPITEEYGDYKRLSAYRKEDYRRTLSERVEHAIREVELMAGLCGKTNIVNYFDNDIVEWEDENKFGCDLLVQMELLHDLRNELKNSHFFEEAEVIQIGKDICSALVVCHGKGILHRDIKPENIFFNDDGDYKLGDFGIARILEKCNSAGSRVGTPMYAAPEQLKSKPYDLQVDIYSLGLVLYELANQNRLPFAESTYMTDSEVMKRIYATTLQTPCGASPDLAKVILKACAHTPSNRYRTAQEMLDALNQIHTTKPGEHRSSTVPVSNGTSDPISNENSYDTEDALPDFVHIDSSQNSAAQQSSVRELLLKANSGDVEAMFRLGQCFYHGSGIKKNYSIATEWYRKAADGGDFSAMYMLGCCYYYGGYGINQNYSLAVEWFQKAADEGYPFAMYRLGDCYYYGGPGLKKNYSFAVEWYQKAAGKGNTEAIFKLGYCYFKGGHSIEKNYSLAVEWFQKAADKGYGLAMCGLGICYYYGYGVGQNYSLAVEWYQKAADKGNTVAMCGLGICYYYGYGVDQNYSLAIEWYQKAADKGDVGAQKWLAEKGHILDE